MNIQYEFVSSPGTGGDGFNDFQYADILGRFRINALSVTFYLRSGENSKALTGLVSWFEEIGKIQRMPVQVIPGSVAVKKIFVEQYGFKPMGTRAYIKFDFIKPIATAGILKTIETALKPVMYNPRVQNAKFNKRAK